MASKNITFDPDAGVPKGVNLTIHTGADFTTNFNVVDTSNAAFNFTGYSGICSDGKECCCWGNSRSHHKFYCWIYQCV